ncbi:hypothetical protein PORCRE_1299 [Porphyromonas crevioricanis JCM 15906]|uniref:Uncharacterized protein n=1 Tax=Porphyromonas crevioricanis JCM 15906 TaxID=1305617 RepID=T1DT41_9PORP|nr:hypothetical protein PORCRE_1299 [Porphyromonas crevioricanis JCM 15906]
MELKRHRLQIFVYLLDPLNRTILELKLSHSSLFLNVNLFSQSHHIGIETRN